MALEDNSESLVGLSLLKVGGSVDIVERDSDGVAPWDLVGKAYYVVGELRIGVTAEIVD